MAVASLDGLLATLPFQSTASQWSASVEEQALTWASHHKLMAADAHARTRSARFGEYAGLQYPQGRPAVVKLAAYLTHYMFHFDDFMASLAQASTPHEVGVEVELVWSAFRGSTEADPSRPLVTAAHDLRAMVLDQSPPEWSARVIEHIGVYLRAHETEFDNLYTRRPPGVDDYILLRRRLGAPLVFTDLCETVAGLVLPPRLYDGDACQLMLSAWSDIALWVNDVVSFPKESRAGDYHNLAIVLQHEQGIGRDQALNDVCQRIEERLHEYLRATEAFQAEAVDMYASQTQRTNVPHYLRTLGTWLAGHIQWHLSTSRYDSVTASALSAP